ncbi:MAG TPA: hypothetical protein VFN35_23065 [Ktedonobacteraceae bacterium]|nr:hypothetical protein [Ktedonobacteraceae bacterium]
MQILRLARRTVIVSFCLTLLTVFALSGTVMWQTHNQTAHANPLGTPMVPLTLCPPLSIDHCVHIFRLAQPGEDGGCPICNAYFERTSVVIEAGNPGILTFTNTLNTQVRLLNSTGVATTLNPGASASLLVPSQAGTYLYSIAGSQMGGQATLRVIFGQTTTG